MRVAVDIALVVGLASWAHSAKSTLTRPYAQPRGKNQRLRWTRLLVESLLVASAALAAARVAYVLGITRNGHSSVEAFFADKRLSTAGAAVGIFLGLTLKGWVYRKLSRFGVRAYYHVFRHVERRIRSSSFAWWVGIALCLLTFGTLGLWWTARGENWAQEWLPNLVAEWSGLLLTVVIVDRVLDAQRRRAERAELAPLRSPAIDRLHRLVLDASAAPIALGRYGGAPHKPPIGMSDIYALIFGKHDRSRINRSGSPLWLDDTLSTACLKRIADSLAGVPEGMQEIRKRYDRLFTVAEDALLDRCAEHVRALRDALCAAIDATEGKRGSDHRDIHQPRGAPVPAGLDYDEHARAVDGLMLDVMLDIGLVVNRFWEADAMLIPLGETGIRLWDRVRIT